MKREFHVRFWESAGAKSPAPLDPRMRRPQRTPRQLGGAERSSSSAIGGVLRGRCVLPRLESGHRGFLQEALA